MTAQPPPPPPFLLAATVLAAALVAGCAAHPTAAPTAPAANQATGEPVPDLPITPAPAGPAAAARALTITLHSHDARPGHDTGPHDANRRTRPLVTPQLYAALADPPTRGAARDWARLTAAQATTSVTVHGVTLTRRTDAPRPHRLDVNVTYTITTRGHGAPIRTSAVQDLALVRHGGRWLVDWLYP